MSDWNTKLKWAKYALATVVFAAVLISIILGTEVFQGDFLKTPSSETAAEPKLNQLPPRQRADLAFQNGMWQVARDSYREVLENDQFNHRAWFRLGYSLHRLDQLNEAAEAYQRANEFNELRIFAQYNLACIHALQDRPDEAIACLRESIEGGFTTTDGIDTEEDLTSLMDDPEFQRLAMIERRRIDRRLRRR